MPRTYREQIQFYKRRVLTETLLLTRGNRTQAAKLLGLQRTYLIRLIHELDIKVPYARP